MNKYDYEIKLINELVKKLNNKYEEMDWGFCDDKQYKQIAEMLDEMKSYD